MSTKPFDMDHIKGNKELGIKGVPDAPGVYIIYDMTTPVYVGRSTRSVRERLIGHKAGRGNWFLKLLAPSPSVSFEYSELWSCQQAEAQLMRALGTTLYGNYRLETDPEMAHLKK